MHRRLPQPANAVAEEPATFSVATAAMDAGVIKRRTADTTAKHANLILMGELTTTVGGGDCGGRQTSRWKTTHHSGNRDQIRVQYRECHIMAQYFLSEVEGPS